MPQFDLKNDAWTEVVAAGGANPQQIVIGIGEALVSLGVPDALTKAIRMGAGSSSIQADGRFLTVDAGVSVWMRPVGPRVTGYIGQASGTTPTPSPTPGATFTMTQLTPLPGGTILFQQRQSTSGGSANLGRGTIPQPLTATTTGDVYARVRSTVGTILQAAWVAATLTSTGAQTVTLADVDAQTQPAYLDLSSDGVTWQQGTTLMGIAAVGLMFGQSQAVRQFAKMPSYVGTFASLGVAPNANLWVYGKYTDGQRSLADITLEKPVDGGAFDSTFLAEISRHFVSATNGAMCVIAGSANGGVSLSTFQPGQTALNTLLQVETAIGGCEWCYGHIGGTDAGNNVTAATFGGWMDATFTAIQSANAARGNGFARLFTAMATRTTDTSVQVQRIREAANAKCADRGWTYIEAHDVVLEDGVHQGQPGSIRLADNLGRALRPLYGQAGNSYGPTLVSAARTTGSAVIELTFNLGTGATALDVRGNAHTRFQVFASGDTTTQLAYDTTTPIAVVGGKVQIKLASAPANNVSLDIYALRHPDPSITLAAADMIYDNFNSDSFTPGRPMRPSLGAATVALAPAGADTTPDLFTFTDATGATPSTVYASNPVTITGIDAPAPISVSGGEYRINGGAWTAASGSVANGSTVEVRGTASASASTAVNVVLNVGGVTDTYTITTAAAGSYVVNSTFTAADGTAAQAAPVEAGGPLTMVSGTAAIASGRYYSTGGNSLATFAGQTATQNQKLTIDFYPVTIITAESKYAVVRYVDATNFIYVGKISGNWAVYTFIGGVSAVQGATVAAGLAAGVNRRMEVRAFDIDGSGNMVTTGGTATRVQLYEGGTLILQRDTAVVFAAGKGVGLRSSGTASTATTGLHFDNLLVESL